MISRRLCGSLARRVQSISSRKYNTIQACPEPGCSCRPMPEGLDIERKLPLEGTIPAYSEQILISTGKADWSSRIEDDETGALARELKALLGPKGKYFDPYRNITLTASSFRSQPAVESPQRLSSGASKQGARDSATIEPDRQSTSVCLFPSFTEYSDIEISAQGAEELVKYLTGASEQQSEVPQGRQIKDIIILICSHGTRDSRCGILGPILQDEFVDQLAHAGINPGLDIGDASEAAPELRARVGSISHIGGHRWAGNVIIYFPPTLKQHPLAGHGVWYGRVSPEHVEGIVQATIREGKLIRELFRGGITPDRQPLRLPPSPT